MTYTLLDSGNFRKLEQIGEYTISRPCPQAVWEPRLRGDWNKSIDNYQRSSSGGGRWLQKKLPETFWINYGGFDLHIKPTNFGHLGVFAEQIDNWNWLSEICSEGMKTLNLFAYTGGSTLAMRRGGSSPTHVDAAKGVVDWARVNAERNKLDGIRWIVDDAGKFLEREIKRGNQYEGIVLDPPSFGRGSRKEIWKIEEHLVPLLKQCRQLMTNPKFLLLSCHSPLYTPKALENLVVSLWGNNVTMESFEMSIPEKSSSRVIPSGACVRVTF